MPGNVPPVPDERTALLAYLAQQRYVLRTAAYGLTDEQARETSTRSSLSIGGLIKHVAATEQYWMDLALQRQRPPEDGEADYMAGFRLEPHETVESVLERYNEVAEETDRAVAAISDLGQAVPIPKDIPWFPDDVEAWSVRWVLLHLIEETARHAGHADIIRESIDGASAMSLLAAVEGWEPAPWLQPWEPPA